MNCKKSRRVIDSPDWMDLSLKFLLKPRSSSCAPSVPHCTQSAQELSFAVEAQAAGCDATTRFIST